MTEAEVLNEIRSHLKVNPIYLKKLDKIEQEDKRVHFKNIEEFDKHFGI
jgi:type II secretory pathway component HofQ